MTGTMRALRLREVDGKIGLHLDDDVPMPTPRPDEVLLKVRACGLNQVDLLTRDGQTPAAIPLPHISGTEVAGDIVAVGAAVTDWQIGDAVVVDPILHCGTCSFCEQGDTNMCLKGRVFGVQTFGGYAEYAAAPAKQLIRKPANLSYAEAASMAVTGPTAYHMLHRRAGIRAGEDVLIIAAGSGIGVIGCQLAALTGARVIATAGSQEKLEQAKALGADFVVNHSNADWADEVRRLTGGRGVHLVFEHVGEATWNGSLHALARKGRLVTCGGHSGFMVGMNLWHLFVKEHSILGSFAATRQDFLAVMKLATEGAIKPLIQQVFPLDGIMEAQALLERRAVFGKLMIDPTLVSGGGDVR
ncbi:zinc-binding dehydrogenase [Aquisediminimonas sediminicola]|uniref:zinc-binding dehydrogenase n=1 Tax=Alteraquisediminimonas sediminicola TaxID=2676787 RepID=UPI001C8D7C35|nr:zinc-binding dehydrogenase [Aquisediminimonas sediminicola]